VVYVADEPELSLHVEWQEILLRSLINLAEELQLVVATHSPDIVGEFQDHVIKLEA
jgi:predicted ATP-dependent endonuclease of OLD family